VGQSTPAVMQFQHRRLGRKVARRRAVLGGGSSTNSDGWGDGDGGAAGAWDDDATKGFGSGYRG
jgi:hypothetical protein